MKRILAGCFYIFFLSSICLAQTGHAISITLRPYKNTWLYLGYYYGKLKGLSDSVMLNANSTGVFKGKDKLPGGIYFVVSPKKEILFEVLIDKEQHFSISGDSAHLPESVVFTGSPDNSVFQQYTKFVNKDGSEITAAQKDLSNAKSAADSTAIREKIKTLNTDIQKYRENIETKYPASTLSALFRAMKEPAVPPADKQPGGKYDTAFAFRYFKSHYWDGVSFTDERLIRTPLFEPKLDKYYKDLVSPEADSINREVDHMLLDARTSKEMFKYLMVHFVQKYVNPEYMGQDAVFVHLFEKYINTGQTDFFTEQYRKFMNDRAYSLMANLIGQPAAELDMVDSLGKQKTLYSVSADFIVLCFWDPTCGHCKEVVPRVDSIYQAKWKAEGVKIVGVMVDGGKDNWVKFIQDHKLNEWIHIYQTQAQHDAEVASNKPGYRQLYDVYQTPTLFLLDKDKRIIAKKLGFEQLDEVISLKLKNPKSK